MKVFLSSTAQDLVAHRRVADDTILRLSQGLAGLVVGGGRGTGKTAVVERVVRAMQASEANVGDYRLVGGHRSLGWLLGEYQRGYRILAAFSRTGRLEDLA